MNTPNSLNATTPSCGGEKGLLRNQGVPKRGNQSAEGILASSVPKESKLGFVPAEMPLSLARKQRPRGAKAPGRLCLAIIWPLSFHGLGWLRGIAGWGTGSMTMHTLCFPSITSGQKEKLGPAGRDRSAEGGRGL